MWAAFAAAPEVTASYAARRPAPQHDAAAIALAPHAGHGGIAVVCRQSLTRTGELASEQEWRIRAAAAHTLTHDHIVDLGVHLRQQRRVPIF